MAERPKAVPFRPDRTAIRKPEGKTSNLNKSKRWRPGLLTVLVMELLVIALGAICSVLVIYAFIPEQASANRVPSRTPVPTVHVTMTPTRTKTPTPTSSATPTPRPTPAVIDGGLFDRWGEVGDAADRRVYLRDTTLEPGREIWVCFNGQTADERGRAVGVVAIKAKGRCTVGLATNVLDEPYPSGKLKGAIGAGVRKDLLGFDSKVFYPILNLYLFYDSPPEGFEVVNEPRG